MQCEQIQSFRAGFKSGFSILLVNSAITWDLTSLDESIFLKDSKL